MTSADWTPDPQLIAAYLDGELDGRPDLAELRARVAAWVEANPAGREETETQRRLTRLWRQTTPAEPDAATWQRTLQRIRQRRPASHRTAMLVVASVACAVLFGGWVLRMTSRPTPPREQAVPVEVFAVAGPGEVTILRIDGDDTETVVVGELPIDGPLELAEPGEVQVTSVQPDENENMETRVRMRSTQRPMVYARLAE